MGAHLQMINYITDDQYSCFFCKKLLVYDGYQNIVVETETHEIHVCHTPVSDTPREKEIYLSSRKDAHELAKQYDTYFSSKTLQTDLKKGAVELERYNSKMSYGQKSKMMNSNNEKDWTTSNIPGPRRRSK
jgi:hypothetical protein